MLLLSTKFIRVSQNVGYFLVSSFGYLIFSLFFTIKFVGKENIPQDGRFILAANHQNFFDGFFLSFAAGCTKKVNFVIAKRALRGLKICEIILRFIGAEIIGDSIEEYQIVIKRLNRILKHEGHIAIFPEGNVSSRNIPGKFKGGVAKLSIDSKTKVIPIYIKGTYNLRSFSYWFKKQEIIINIGKSVDLYKFSDHFGNNLEQVVAVLREKIIELADEAPVRKEIIHPEAGELLYSNIEYSKRHPAK